MASQHEMAMDQRFYCIKHCFDVVSPWAMSTVGRCMADVSELGQEAMLIFADVPHLLHRLKLSSKATNIAIEYFVHRDIEHRPNSGSGKNQQLTVQRGAHLTHQTPKLP